MKKLAILAIFALIVAGAYSSYQPQGSISNNQTLFQGSKDFCQDIYAYYFNYRCCGEVKGDSGTITIKGTSADDGNEWFTCDTKRCEITKTNLEHPDQSKFFYTHTNGASCEKFNPCWNVQNPCYRWKCDGESEMTQDSVTLKKGDKFWGWQNNFNFPGEAEYQKYKLELAECQLSPCDPANSPKVTGSSGCTFVTDKDIYNKKGGIVEGKDVQGGISYTVASRVVLRLRTQSQPTPDW